MWKIKKLDELSGREFYELLTLRIDTFIVSQKRIYQELDTNDKIAYHIFYQVNDSEEVLAYARLFSRDNHLTFGRVVTSEKVRGTGMGKQLMQKILVYQKKYWPEMPIIIESQKQVVPFYEKFGFRQISREFILKGTPHIKMRLDNKKM